MSFKISEEQLVQLAEYVGANESLGQDVINACASLMKNYEKIYRMWSDVDSDITDEKLLMVAQMRSHVACTLSFSVIERIMDEVGYDPNDVIITLISGVGFDPVEALRLGLRQHPNHKERRFILDVINTFAWQEEILLTRVKWLTTEI